jgi:hypothetical protein
MINELKHSSFKEWLTRTSHVDLYTAHYPLVILNLRPSHPFPPQDRLKASSKSNIQHSQFILRSSTGISCKLPIEDY